MSGFSFSEKKKSAGSTIAEVRKRLAENKGKLVEGTIPTIKRKYTKRNTYDDVETGTEYIRDTPNIIDHGVSYTTQGIKFWFILKSSEEDTYKGEIYNHENKLELEISGEEKEVTKQIQDFLEEIEVDIEEIVVKQLDSIVKLINFNPYANRWVPLNSQRGQQKLANNIKQHNLRDDPNLKEKLKKNKISGGSLVKPTHIAKFQKEKMEKMKSKKTFSFDEFG